jgi:hypothetical protein
MPRCLTDEEVLACVSGQGEARAALAHLDACAKCRTLVACAVENGDSSGAGSCAAGSPETTIKIGATVAGRYEIRRFLGKGGMGEVYEAHDTALGHMIALKTLAMTALDDAKAVARLKAEVLLARRVAHPNVCRIFDFGVHESRRADRAPERLPFLTMELLTGQTLGQRLRQHGPMGLDQARSVIEQIVAGLAEVHRAGIIHRDLKSENVFLAKSEAGERVVLMDFGLARTMPLADLASDSLAHGLVGTVAYMSPEQIQRKPLGPPADIYALGVVLYEMMTGKHPFSGATAFDLALERLRRLPASPATVSPKLPRACVRTIMRCLAIDPAKRFRSVTEVLDALDGTQRGRSPRWWIASAAGGAALLIGVAAMWLHRPPHGGADAIPANIHVVPVAPAVPAVPARPTATPVAADPAPTADRRAALAGGNEAALPALRPAPTPSSQRHANRQRKTARPVATRDVAEALPAAGRPVADDRPASDPIPPDEGPGIADKPPAAPNPADRIFNPFAAEGSAP